MAQLSTLLDLIWEFLLAGICQEVVAVELRAKEGSPFSGVACIMEHGAWTGLSLAVSS